MPSAAERDRDALMRTHGWRLLLVGGILAAAGLVVGLLASAGYGLGVVLAWLAVVPTLAGAGLVGASHVARRAGQDKPFA